MSGLRSELDFWDETLREGAERASVSITTKEKIAVAKRLSDIGIKTVVVGMLPEIPSNIALLSELILQQQQGAIASDVRFVVISHVGHTAEKSLHELKDMGLPLETTWLMLIHSVSDQQIRHMFPFILNNYSLDYMDSRDWEEMENKNQREYNKRWLFEFLSEFNSDALGGIALGLLDYFRADLEHIDHIISIAQSAGISDIRMVDTAGTCTPELAHDHVEPMTSKYPEINFYGHFHNDFGMATANSIRALNAGLRGVDVSVGGFANRAGHPPLAEVIMSLKHLYGKTINGFHYEQLYSLSRFVEEIYCLPETPTQPITGIITHDVTSGIRTQLVKKCRTIFDVIDPDEVGATLYKTFGIRSGIDGIRRLIKMYQLDSQAKFKDDDIQRLYEAIFEAWEEKSLKSKSELRERIKQLNQSIKNTILTEEAVLSIIDKELSNRERV